MKGKLLKKINILKVYSIIGGSSYNNFSSNRYGSKKNNFDADTSYDKDNRFQDDEM